MNYFHFINNSETFEGIQFTDAYVVRLQGVQLPNTSSVYGHLRECLEFPDYFGNNLDALYDCLTDLEWINQKNIVFFIDQFDDIASLEAENNFRTEFILCLYDASLTWTEIHNSEHQSKNISVYITWTKNAEQLLNKLDIPYELN